MTPVSIPESQLNNQTINDVQLSDSDIFELLTSLDVHEQSLWH